MKRVPQGDLLRQYLLKSSINTTILSELLKSKCVLIKSRNKKATLPYFLKTLIDAKLFNNIENSEVFREKQHKFTNASIKIKNDFKIEKICEIELNLQEQLIEKNEFKLNYSFKNVPEFYIDSSNKDQIKVSLDIEIEIEDQLENYNSTKIERNAKIDVILEKDVLIIHKDYTSPETKEVVDFVVERVRKYLKEEHFIEKNEDFFSIRLEDFSAEKSMKVKGNNLENHPFLEDKNYYSKILVSGIKIKFDFELPMEKGEIILNLGFPHFKSDSIDEDFSNPIFVFSINVINCLNKTNVYKITSELAVIIEKYKNQIYPHYKK